MTPVGVAGREALVEVGGLGVHLGLARPADDDVAEQRHPPAGAQHVVRSPPADRRVDPVPRRRGHEDVEAPAAVVPLLERRRLDLDVREAGEPPAGERGHAGARLDGGHRAPERGQRARRLAGAAAHLEHRRPLVHAGDGDEVREQLVGVGRPHPVVELRHLVEHGAEVLSFRPGHVPHLGRGVAPIRVRPAGHPCRRHSDGP